VVLLDSIVGVVGDAGRDLLFEFVKTLLCLITCCLFSIIIGDTVLFLLFEGEPCEMMQRFNLIAESKGHRVRRCLGETELDILVCISWITIL